MWTPAVLWMGMCMSHHLAWLENTPVGVRHHSAPAGDPGCDIARCVSAAQAQGVLLAAAWRRQRAVLTALQQHARWQRGKRQLALSGAVLLQWGQLARAAQRRRLSLTVTAAAARCRCQLGHALRAWR
jgi:hypothetical protein